MARTYEQAQQQGSPTDTAIATDHPESEQNSKMLLPAQQTDDAKELRAPYKLDDLPDAKIILDRDLTTAAVATFRTELARIRRLAPFAAASKPEERLHIIPKPHVGDGTISLYIEALNAVTALCVSVSTPGPDTLIIRRMTQVFHDLLYNRVIAPELKVSGANTTPIRIHLIRSLVAAAMAALIETGQSIDDAGHDIERHWPEVGRIAVRRVTDTEKASGGWKKAVDAYEQITKAWRDEIDAGSDPLASMNFAVSNFARHLAGTKKMQDQVDTLEARRQVLIYCANLYITTASSWMTFEPHPGEAN